MVHGLGSVGSHLIKFLHSEQARILVFDIKDSAIKKIQKDFPKLQVLSSEEAFSTDCEVFAPCAGGSVINEQSLSQLKCPIVAGGANNQLSSPSMARKLLKKEITYIPDFVINSGGLIYVSSGLKPKKSVEWVEKKIRFISPSILKICEQSLSEGEGTAQIALKMAREKIKRTEFLN